MFNQYDDLLNVEDLCEILGIGKNVTYSILSTDEIKAFRTGRMHNYMEYYPNSVRRLYFS